MADGISVTKPTATRLRKANECITSVKRLKPPVKLFDEFWREGELALLFGPQGTGKSILAVQIAEAIARGRGIDGFEMSEKRHKVLYVDLKLSERQFGMRYTNEGKPYKLSENLYRDRPAADEDLCKWLREKVSECGVRVIVIDDLSAIRQTFDGTRETLKLMRELKQLKDELDVSILVLAGSREQRRGALVCEADLIRSRVLCDAADSVFALGVHAGNPNFRYLVQTRSLGGPIKWHARNGPVCSIRSSDEGLLGMAFDERFVAEVDEETRQLICNVKWRKDAGASYREIADKLGISRSTAFRLCKKWTAALEKDLVIEPEAHVSQDAEESGGNATVMEHASSIDGTLVNTRVSARSSYPMDVSAIPFAAALKRIHVKDLKRGVDGYGREMFIEKEFEYNGKPIVWYQYDSKGKLIRKDRSTWGITISRPETPWISSLTFISPPSHTQGTMPG